MTHNADPSKQAGDRDDFPRILGSVDPTTLLPRSRDQILGDIPSPMTPEQVEALFEHFSAIAGFGEVALTGLSLGGILPEPYGATDKLPFKEFEILEKNTFDSRYELKELKESKEFNPVNLELRPKEDIFTQPETMRSFQDRIAGDRYRLYDEGLRSHEEPTRPLFDNLKGEYPISVAKPTHEVPLPSVLSGIVEKPPAFVFIDTFELSERGLKAIEDTQHPESSPAKTDEE